MLISGRYHVASNIARLTHDNNLCWSSNQDIGCIRRGDWRLVAGVKVAWRRVEVTRRTLEIGRRCLKIGRRGVKIARRGMKIVRWGVKIVRWGVKIARWGVKIIRWGVKIGRGLIAALRRRSVH